MRGSNCVIIPISFQHFPITAILLRGLRHWKQLKIYEFERKLIFDRRVLQMRPLGPDKLHTWVTWNDAKPSAALDRWTPTWLTNHLSDVNMSTVTCVCWYRSWSTWNAKVIVQYNKKMADSRNCPIWDTITIIARPVFHDNYINCNWVCTSTEGGTDVRKIK